MDYLRPLTADRWNDLVELVGSREAVFTGTG